MTRQNPPGRPRSLREGDGLRVVELLEAGLTLRAAAGVLGCSARTLERALARDPLLGKACALARQVSAARPPPPRVSPPSDWREIAARLEAHFPMRWFAPLVDADPLDLDLLGP
jgi:hypothetical protein